MDLSSGARGRLHVHADFDRYTLSEAFTILSTWPPGPRTLLELLQLRLPYRAMTFEEELKMSHRKRLMMHASRCCARALLSTGCPLSRVREWS